MTLAVGAQDERGFSWCAPRFAFVDRRHRVPRRQQDRAVGSCALITQLVQSDPEESAAAAARGYYCLDKSDLEQYLGHQFGKQQGQRLKDVPHLDEPGAVWLVKFWRIEPKALPDIDPLVTIRRKPLTVDAFPDERFLAGIVDKRNWKVVVIPIKELGPDYTMDDLVAQLPGDLPPPVLDPPKPSGLEPTEPSFESVPPDAFVTEDGVTIHVGGRAGGVLHAFEAVNPLFGEVRRFMPLARPSEGTIQVRPLHPLMETAQAELHERTHGRFGERELVVGSSRAPTGGTGRYWSENPYTIPTTWIKKPIIVVPAGTTLPHMMALQQTSYVYEQYKPGEHRVDEEPLCVQEPSTAEQDMHEMTKWASTLASVDAEHVRRCIVNEIILQAVPERQPNFEDTAVVLRNQSIADALALTDGKMVWAGDRNLTLEIYLSAVGDDRPRHAALSHVLGSRIARGWRTAPPPPDKNGRPGKRRRKRVDGFLLPETHLDTDSKSFNYITYSMETRVLTIRLALGFYHENLEFERGAVPPPKKKEIAALNVKDVVYDIVDREWRKRTDEPALTLMRAEAHFGDTSYVYS